MNIRCTQELLLSAAGLALLAGAPVASGQWVEFANETSSRSIVDSSIFAGDDEEKDYAWGDIDQDGDVDLVIMRKTPFTSAGRRTNVLLMNEGGVLVDRTSEFATATDVPGDNGFLTPTNDRDSELVDVDGDGWVDLITVVTLGDFLPKEISHPRVYMNLGNDAEGNWQGFRFESARFPQIAIPAGANQNAAPRFCSIAVGDFTGDGAPDLYLGDYDSGEAGPQLFDFNNRLMINDGNGFFSDQSTQRMNNEMLASAFGVAGEAADINADGVMDIVKQTSLGTPQHVAVIYNDVNNEGFFFNYDTINSQAPYFVSQGDLNNDGRIDLAITDDGQDRFMINQGPLGANVEVNWSTHSFSYSGSGDQGFGEDSYIVDLDNDGWNDVLIADVDVDIPGCGRRMSIYRNEGGVVGGVPVLRETVSGGTIASIPTSMLVGTHDVAPIDINGDGWLDLVIGRCTGTQIWMNQPPINIAFSFPNGTPEVLVPNTATEVVADLSPIGGDVDASTVRLVGSFTQADNAFDIQMTDLGNGQFAADLPAVECGSSVVFEVVAELEGADFEYSSGMFNALAADGFETTLDAFEGPVASWTVDNDANLTSGAWEQAEPNGTVFQGSLAAPDSDNTVDGVNAFVTQNGAPGGSAGAADIDNGATRLTSPTIDLSGADATISYSRWFVTNNLNDELVTEVSNDNGATWTEVSSTTGTGSAWETASFVVSQFVTPTDSVRVRFTAGDLGSQNIVEAGIDDFEVTASVCDVTPACPGDLDGDNVVDAIDLGILLGGFGGSGAGDINEDGVVDAIDLGVLLGNFGGGC